MNLYDIVKRRDWGATFDPALLQAREIKINGVTERCVSIAPKGAIVIRRADEMVCLASAPQVLGWQILAPESGRAEIEISVQDARNETRHSVLCRIKVIAGEHPRRVMLEWPAWTGDRSGHSLTVSNHGVSEALVAVGPLFSARPNLLAQLRGSGVEVGPGANPCVKPSEKVSVKYVERMPAEEWANVYGKRLSDDRMAALWKNYAVASAEQLETFSDESLDFIFSNHVFEHLVNPLGVLRNWYTKLKPNGVVAAVIPDARFTFDLRQPLSTLTECVQERDSGAFELEECHYQKWCRCTAPYNTPDDLMRRRYSIHAKYYSPESFRAMAEYSLRELSWAGIFVQSTLNGKDFGVMLRKSDGVSTKN